MHPPGSPSASPSIRVSLLGVRQSSRLRGAKSSSGGDKYNTSAKAAVFKRGSLLIGGPSMSIGGGAAPLGASPGAREFHENCGRILAD